jgi:hypothetical protein
MRWSAQIHTAFHVCRITQELPRAALDFGYGDVTLYVGTFQFLLLSIAVPRRGPTTPETSLRFGLIRFRSPLLTESILFLFLRLLRCFTSPGIAYCFLTSLLTISIAQDGGRASETDNDVLPPLGYPIREPPDHSVLTTPRSLSQLIAPFIAC